MELVASLLDSRTVLSGQIVLRVVLCDGAGCVARADRGLEWRRVWPLRRCAREPARSVRAREAPRSRRR